MYSSWSPNHPEKNQGEFEVIGPETLILKIENWGVGACYDKDTIIAAPTWEEIEKHLKDLVNSSLTLLYKNQKIVVNGSRTPSSFVSNAEIDPSVFIPDTFRIFGRKENLWGDYPSKDHSSRANLEDVSRIAKNFVDTGVIAEMQWEPLQKA